MVARIEYGAVLVRRAPFSSRIAETRQRPFPVTLVSQRCMHVAMTAADCVGNYSCSPFSITFIASILIALMVDTLMSLRIVKNLNDLAGTYYLPAHIEELRKVFTTYNNSNRWWDQMYRNTRFDLSTATVHPIVGA